MSRYLLMLRSDENAAIGGPPAELFEAIGALAAEWTQAGVLLDTGGLAPTAVSTRIRLAADEITGTDGPFADADQTVTAYAIIRADSQEQATDRATEFLEVHRKNWKAWEGSSEIRQIFGTADA
jgi:hypothetical protein